MLYFKRSVTANVYEIKWHEPFTKTGDFLLQHYCNIRVGPCNSLMSVKDSVDRLMTDVAGGDVMLMGYDCWH